MRKFKIAFIALFLMANLYGVLCGGLYFFQENLLFHPTQLAQNHRFEFDATFTEVMQQAADGAQLHGLYFKTENPQGTLLYFHGNAGDLSRWGEIVQFFVQKNLNVVVMDYRNFGKSSGMMNEKALYEDARLWYAYAKDVAKKTNTPLLVYGRSLGTTFATAVAAQNDVEQLILETPFYSIEDEAKSRFSWLPVRSLLKYRMPTYTFINQVNCPITIIHGTQDEVVAYEHGKRLYESFSSDNKTFVTVPGGHHNDLINYPEYHQVIEQLFGSN